MAGVTPRSFNLADVWEMAADAVPDREALVVGDRRLTYARLEDRVNRLANHLAGRGIGAGDHVGLYLENCTEYVEAMLGFEVHCHSVSKRYRRRTVTAINPSARQRLPPAGDRLRG